MLKEPGDGSVLKMAPIYTTSQHVLRVLQTSISSFTKFIFLGSLTREEGEAFFWNWKEWPRLLEKMPRLRVTMGKCLIKNAILEVPRWKKAPNFSPSGILFICCSWNVSWSGLISRSLIYPENWLHAWSTTMVGWQRKRSGFGPARKFSLSMISYSHNLSILKLIFHSHDT